MMAHGCRTRIPIPAIKIPILGKKKIEATMIGISIKLNADAPIAIRTSSR